ncbi:MAG: hypothetical protein LBB46_01185, partial [Coriobacteriaceae bacterium]|nr:hypothetical protein [Coriobacteriaceae bacterium]
LDVNVFNARDNAPTDKILEPKAAPDDGADLGYTYTGTTTQSAEALANPQATNMAGAWKKVNESAKVKKIELIMKEADGTVVGTAEISGDDIVEGREIDIPLDYYFFEEMPDTTTGIIHTIMHHASAKVTYVVKKDAQGGYYLHFNKMTNPPTGEVEYVQWNTDSTGIVAEKPAYVNDINHHITINIYADMVNELVIEKNLTEAADAEETFVFKVEYRGNDAAPGAVERLMYAVVTIPAGQDFGRAVFTDMETGFYTVTELGSNWTYTLMAGRLEGDHAGHEPAATVSPLEGSVTLWAEDSRALYTYWNERDEVPWIFDKSSITNNMPSISTYR